jgi:hypothetical protein
MKKRAFARYTKKGQLVPGSLIITTQGGYPNKTSLWKEVDVDLFQEANKFLPWKVVTTGEAGDGIILGNVNSSNLFTVIGPDDDVNDGWVYLKRYFPLGAEFSIDYKWASHDDSGISNPPNVDWPVYWTSVAEPTGIPSDLTVRVSGTPANGTWNITVNPGEWFSIGIYSDDSCCGRGFLQLSFNL